MSCQFIRIKTRPIIQTSLKGKSNTSINQHRLKRIVKKCNTLWDNVKLKNTCQNIIDKHKSIISKHILMIKALPLKTTK